MFRTLVWKFNKIHETSAKHSEMLNKHSETLTKHSDTLARLESDVSDVNRKLTDLSMDTPSRSEFNKHGQKFKLELNWDLFETGGYMDLTKKNLKDIAEIVGVTIVQYHDLNVSQGNSIRIHG